MPFLELTKSRLYYEVHGSGSPLLLISGLGARHDTWYGVLPRLSDLYQVILVDNRGSGQSTQNNQALTLVAMAEDLLALLDALSLAAVQVVGHSMGGAIALHLAAMAPDRVKKLVAYSVSCQLNQRITSVFESVAELQQANVGVATLCRLLCPILFAEKFLKNKEHVDAIVEYEQAYPYPQSAESFKCQLDAIKQADVPSLLAQIHQPCLVLGGEQDWCNPPHELQQLAGALSHAQHRLIPDVGHSLHIEKPSIFTQEVLTFLALI